MFLSERRLGAFTNEVRTEVDHDGPLAPEPEVILMEIVRHTRPTLTVSLSERSEILLRSLNADANDRLEESTNSVLFDVIGVAVGLSDGRDFDLSDTVSEASLIPIPKLHSLTLATNIVAPALATHENLHHAANRRSESRIGSDLLTLICGERFGGGREQLDSVLALHVRASVVAEESGLRAHSIRLRAATNHIAIDAAHDRVHDGANGNETRVERSLAHGYQYTRRGRTLQTLLF